MNMPGCKLFRSGAVFLNGMRNSGISSSWPLAVLLSLSICSASAVAATPFENQNASETVLRDEVNTVVAGKLADHPAPGGYTIAIVHDGKIVFSGAYGFSDAEHHRPMRTDAIFPIASVTKTMTAFLAAKLSERGIVSLKAPIKGYLPATVTFNENFGSRQITLESLLLHTSGLPRDRSTRRNIALPQMDGFDPTIPDHESANVDALFEALSLDAPVSPIEGRSYSNMGYDLAGHVLEIATRRSFPDLLKSEITQPLGMNDTTVYRTRGQDARIPVGYSYDSGRKRFWRTPTWRTGRLAGAAGVSSTAEDLARYIAAMMDPEKLRALSDGDPEVGAVLLKPRVEYFQDPYSLFAQAFGWRMNVFGPYGLVYRHKGDADSHLSFVAFSRLHRIGIVVLASNGGPLIDEIGNALLLRELQRRADAAAPAIVWQALQSEEAAMGPSRDSEPPGTFKVN